MFNWFKRNKSTIIGNGNTVIQGKSSIVINGKTTIWNAGDSLEDIVIENTKISFKDFNQNLVINVYVSGDVNGTLSTVSGNISTNGNVNDEVKSTSGDIVIHGNVEGNVKTVSGNVKGKIFKNNVSTVSGNCNIYK